VLAQKQRKKQVASYLSNIEKRFQEKGIEAKPYMACGPVVGTILMDGSYQGMCRSVAARLLERADKPLLLIRNGNND
jgi:hypothetical protein